MAITTTTPSGADATYKAEIAAISGITISDSGTTQTQLQTALDSGVAKVVVNSDITTTSTLTVPSGVVLVINRNSIIECTADEHVIEIKPGAFVTGGGTVYNSNASSASACLFLDGSTDTFSRPLMPTGATDLYLRNGGIGQGQGIKLYAESGTGIKRVEWTHFTDINISYVEDCIYIECNEDSGDDNAYVNGNFFSNIGMDFLHYGVRTVLGGTGAPAITGNHYVNLQIQTTTPTTVSAIVEAGTSNIYGPVRVYDFGGTTAIDITGTANVIEVTGVTHDEISKGDTNQIYSTILPRNMPYISQSSVQAIDPTEWPGALVYNNSRQCLALATTNGWRYFAGGLNEVSKTSSGNVLLGDGTTVINNVGASGSITLTILSPQIGQEMIFRRDASHAMIINPTAGTQFLGKADGAYKSLDSDDAYLHVRCYIASTWTVLFESGTIADE